MNTRNCQTVDTKKATKRSERIKHRSQEETRAISSYGKLCRRDAITAKVPFGLLGMERFAP
jgi:hypothetical protein